MRPLSNLLYRNCSNMSEPRLPTPRPPDPRKSIRRRMEDQIEALYNRARIGNDLEAASDLLALLEKWFARRPVQVGRERRTNAAALLRARRDLEQLTRARQSKP